MTKHTSGKWKQICIYCGKETDGVIDDNGSDLCTDCFVERYIPCDEGFHGCPAFNRIGSKTCKGCGRELTTARG